MIEILYQDAQLVVCIKPAGLLSQADASNQSSLLSELSAQLGGTMYPVHRLDRPVGGVMVVARTSQAAAALGTQAANRTMKKRYWAVICGQPQPVQGDWEDWLYHDVRANKTYVVQRQRRGVKKALLSYSTLQTISGEAESLSLMSIELKTGRTHQIRAQFAGHQFPLAGDGRYGSHSKGEPALWSVEVQFTHPLTGESLAFAALPPAVRPWNLFSLQEDLEKS